LNLHIDQELCLAGCVSREKEAIMRHRMRAGSKWKIYKHDHKCQRNREQ
jgi:hypothetical protein